MHRVNDNANSHGQVGRTAAVNAPFGTLHALAWAHHRLDRRAGMATVGFRAKIDREPGAGIGYQRCLVRGLVCAREE